MNKDQIKQKLSTNNTCFVKHGRTVDSTGFVLDRKCNVVFSPFPYQIIVLCFRVFSEMSQVTNNLTHPRFQLTEDEEEADIIWCFKHIKDFRSGILVLVVSILRFEMYFHLNLSVSCQTKRRNCPKNILYENFLKCLKL